MNYIEKMQRISNEIQIIPSDEEELFRKKFKDLSTDKKCTICGTRTKNTQAHPALSVIVCPDCFQFYENAVFISNKDGTDKNCRWCAKLSSAYCCSSCTVVFCAYCLNRNFGTNYVDTYVRNNPDWKCLICNHKQLWALRAQCANAHAVRACATLGDDDTSSLTTFKLEDIPDTLNKILTPEIIEKASEIFEPSRNNFQRLVNKLEANNEIFSAVAEHQELKRARDVLELTRKVSSMCKCIQKVILWIHERNKLEYKNWFDQYVFEETATNNVSDDLLNIAHASKSQNVIKIQSPEGPVSEKEDEDDVTDTVLNKSTRKRKSKQLFQKLRLKKAKTESHISGVS